MLEVGARSVSAPAWLAPFRACVLCPRRCGVDRTAGRLGRCGVAAELRIGSVGAHFGEEDVLVGTGGSGAIFLAGCNLLCRFCQNEDLSHGRRGRPFTVDACVAAMRALEADGCHNVNFVTPTHVTPLLAEAIRRARAAGLRLPVVYNCGGYESVETLRSIEGLVDIYMPDFKFWRPETAAALADAPDYPQVARDALLEMHRQVGDLEVVGDLARRGLLVRHLVMPGGADEGLAILDFLADRVSARTFVNVMDQYRPCHEAWACPGLDRFVTAGEFRRVRDHAAARGLRLVE
jgi:putative pyruvate formate lyase activating enzyme